MGLDALISGTGVLLIVVGVVLVLFRRQPPATHRAAHPGLNGWDRLRWSGAVSWAAVGTGGALMLAPHVLSLTDRPQAANGQPAVAPDAAVTNVVAAPSAVSGKLSRTEIDDATRRAIARAQARQASDRAQSVALTPDVKTDPLAWLAPTASGQAPPVTTPPPVEILVEAVAYGDKSASDLRRALSEELRLAGEQILEGQPEIIDSAIGFRDAVGRGQPRSLCNDTQAGSLMLADLAPAGSDRSTGTDPSPPTLRLWAVQCRTGRISRTDPLPLVATPGDRFPYQQSVAGSARDFLTVNRHLFR